MKPRGYWTKERCREAALQCQTRSEFMRSCPSAYTLAHQKSWLDDFCGHMTSVQEKSGHWIRNKENCRQAALFYRTRKEFSVKNPSPYQAARKNGWLDEICRHMDSVQKPRGFWTKIRCQEIAIQYKSRKEFDQANTSAYQTALKRGWLDEICAHMIPRSRKRGYWNKENCQLEALKYKSRKEFQKNSDSAFGAAFRNGFLDEICGHMERVGNRHHKIVYAYEFPDRSVYVGLTFNMKRRQWQRDHNEKDAVTRYAKSSGLTPVLKLLSDYINVNDAVKLEGEFIEKYKGLGWQCLNVAKAGSIGGDVLIKLTKEKCIQIASGYKTISELKSRSVSVYNAAKMNHWLDECTAHMVIKKPNGYWNKARCQKEALKYSNRRDFLKNCGAAYTASQKGKWLSEICAHMKQLVKEKGYWTKDKCHQEALRYKSRVEYQRNSVSYQSAQANGWLDEICDHMPFLHRPKWTKEECRREAAKYKTRTEFNKMSSGAYTAAWREGWLDEIIK